MNTLGSGVNRLKVQPFPKNVTSLSFESLADKDLIQALVDVIHQVDSHGSPLNVKNNDLEEVCDSIFRWLTIFRYPLLNKDDDSAIREGIKCADKAVILPILDWLVENEEMLRERVYLSQYLTKLEVPFDILGYADIATLYQQYEESMEKFMQLHGVSKSSLDSRKISATHQVILREKNAIFRNIETLWKKIHSFSKNASDMDKLLTRASDLRKEREKSKNVEAKCKEELIRIQKYESRLENQMNQRKVNVTSRDLLNKLREDTSASEYVARVQLPKELSNEHKLVNRLRSLAIASNTTSAANKSLRRQEEALTEHVKKLLDGRTFRPTFGNLTNNKDEIAQKFAKLKEQLVFTNQLLAEKRRQLLTMLENRKNDDEESEAEKQLREYAGQLRAKSAIYKKCRVEYAKLRNNETDLTRKKSELLDRMERNSIQLIKRPESDENQEDETASDRNIFRLTNDIADLRAKLLPHVTVLKNLRIKSSQVFADHEQCMALRERTLISLRANYATTQKKVSHLREECEKRKKRIDDYQKSVEEAKRHLLESQPENCAFYRDEFHRRILEAQHFSHILKQERDNLVKNSLHWQKQLGIWTELSAVIEEKLKYISQKKHITQKSDRTEMILLMSDSDQNDSV